MSKIMYKPKFFFSILLCVCLSVSVLSLGGCFGIPSPRDLAAKVNKSSIYEDELTAYIEAFRAHNEAYIIDSDWSQYLLSIAKTPETYRRYVLDTIFIPNLIIEQQCKKRNIVLSDPELSRIIDAEQDFYEQNYGANSWDAALASYNYDEKTWRDSEKIRILRERLQESVIKHRKVSKSQVLAYINNEASTYNGKHSYYREFASLDEAQDAYDQLTGSGQKTQVTLRAFRKLKNCVSAGWSSLSSDAQYLSSIYKNALSDLEQGQVSQAIEDADSVYLIYCDASFDVDTQKNFVSFKDIPKKIYKQLRLDAAEQYYNDRFDAWLEKCIAKAKIVYTDMPDGLSYDL